MAGPVLAIHGLDGTAKTWMAGLRRP